MSTRMPVECFISNVMGTQHQSDGEPFLESRPGEDGHLIYGPYNLVEPGDYIVEFKLALGEVPKSRLGDFICVTLDVMANTGATMVAERHVRLSQLSSEPRTIAIEFRLQEARRLEYRVKSTGQAGILVGTRPELSSVTNERLDLPVVSISDRERNNELDFFDGYLRNVSGLIHIGANTGQERFLYQIVGLDVIWIEAIPAVYQELVDNITALRRQRAINALLSDTVGETVTFNISSHGGGSSSILPFQEHSEIIPEVKYIDEIELVSTTLEEIVRDHYLDVSKYEALTIDAEGAELLILRGAGNLLYNFKYILCEVSDFPSRTGCPTSADLDDFLAAFGFKQLVRMAFAYGTSGNGTYWNIVWKRQLAESSSYEGIELPMINNKTWDRVGT